MNSISSVFYFFLFIFSIVACCNICKCFCNCMCNWADYWYELKLEERHRQTQISPRQISPREVTPVFIPPSPNKIIPADKYIVVMNPQGHPISLGLPKEYSNV
jgi:hypothetical protein